MHFFLFKVFTRNHIELIKTMENLKKKLNLVSHQIIFGENGI